MRSSQRHDAEDQVCMSSLEERGQIIRICCLLFLRTAISHQMREQADCHTSEGMTCQYERMFFIHPRNQSSAGKVRTIAFMSALFTMGFPVVCTCACQLCVEFTCTVPSASARRYGCSVRRITLAVQQTDQITVPHSPVGHSFILHVIAAPAGQTVHEYKLQLFHK